MNLITVVTDVQATESVEKVKQAVSNLFPDVTFEMKDKRLVAQGCNLDVFQGLLEKQRIRDTARGQFLKGLTEETIVFQLHKQAAYGNKINFSVMEHPLGELHVTLASDDPRGLIDYLTNKERG